MPPYGRSAAASLAGRFTATGPKATFSSPSTTTTSSTTPIESLSQRSLFVKVRPPPVSLSERRSVLGVLERYGKADMFKKMADNGSFICIASSTAMAAALVQRSPLQYELLSETLQNAQPWGQPRVATRVQPIETTNSPSGDRRQTDTVEHRSFVLSVFPSQDYHHRTMVRNSPLHGPWPRDRDEGTSIASVVTANADGYRDTFVHNALKAVVPESASAEALCDWRPRAESGGGSSRDSKESHSAVTRIQERRARRAHANKSILSSLVKTGSNRGGSEGKPEETKRPNQ